MVTTINYHQCCLRITTSWLIHTRFDPISQQFRQQRILYTAIAPRHTHFWGWTEPSNDCRSTNTSWGSRDWSEKIWRSNRRFVAHTLPTSTSSHSSFTTKLELGGFGGAHARVEIKVRISHPGEVNRFGIWLYFSSPLWAYEICMNRARYMPQNPSLIATQTTTGEVLVFDYTRHASNEKDAPRPELRLAGGHTEEGY